MNLGELKFQNTSFNSQLQLNNDLLNPNKSNVSKFDDILKGKTINRSVEADDSFRRQNDLPKATLINNSKERFNKNVESDFSKRNANQANGLRKQINEEIAQNKFSKQKDNVKSDENKNANASEDASTIEGIEEKLKALEEKIKAELGIQMLDETVIEELLPEELAPEELLTEELMSEIAVLLGVDVEVVEALMLNGTSEEAIDSLAESIKSNPEVIEILSEKLELISDEDVLEKFNEVLKQISNELPSDEVKVEIDKLIDKVDFKIANNSDIVEVKEEVATEIVSKENNDANVKSENAVKNVEIINTDKAEVVTVKENESNDKQDASEGDKSKLDLKSDTKVQTDSGKEFAEQVNVMKDQNTNISSTKVEQPKMMLAKSVTNQIVQGAKMSVNLSDVGSEILIKLNPKNLGNVALKMSFEKGVLIAQINVENQTVKALVESNLEDLKNSLKDEGYMIGELDVSVNKDNSEHQQQEFEQHLSKDIDNETFEEIEEKVMIEKQRLVSDERVDYFA